MVETTIAPVNENGVGMTEKDENDTEEDEELQRIRRKKMQRLLEADRESGPESSPMGPDAPITVTDGTFPEVVRRHPLVVIDCWAPWCGPCRMVSPIIEELARDYAGKIVFGKLNVDRNRKTAATYNVMSIPTILIFKDGKLVDSQVGAMPRNVLEARIRNIFRSK